MIPVLTAKEIREIDRESISGDLELGFSYMEKAAEGLFETVKTLVPPETVGDFQLNKKITVVCGKGNNGGDGFLLAMKLKSIGYSVDCFSSCSSEDLKGEARKAYEAFLLESGQVEFLEDDFTKLEKSISEDCSLIVDALLGTGIQGDPKDKIAKIINLINKSKVRVLSVDTPSGINNDDGSVFNPSIVANTTVTMAYPKLGLLFYPGRANVGNLYIKDLEYPLEILKRNFSNIYIPSHEDLSDLLPARKPSGSKFDHGVCLMLCGSKGMSGAAILSSSAAMRSGAGYVNLASPASLESLLAENLKEVVCHSMPETKSGQLSLKAENLIKELSKKSSAICIGPGLAHEDEVSSLVRILVKDLDKPIVLDADGINAFKSKVEDLKKHKSEILITPHQGEWERLFGELPEKPINKIEELKKKAKEFNMNILLKGSPTIVVDTEDNAYILPYGNSGLATAGSGDVLSGIVTALAAQGASLKDAAILAAYLHGTAGVKASEELTEYGMMAGDILGKIPAAIKEILPKL